MAAFLFRQVSVVVVSRPVDSASNDIKRLFGETRA
jgi:hypothetical protein